MTLTVSGPQASQSVCLAPWRENPYGLIDLLSMLEFSTRNFFAIGLSLERLWQDCLMSGGAGQSKFHVSELYKPLEPAIRDHALSIATALRQCCAAIGLRISAETAGDLIQHIESGGAHAQSVMNHVSNLRKLVDREIRGHLFFWIPSDRIRYVPTKEQPNVFSPETCSAFPSAVFDLTESGWCIVAARPTAAVFHLMRALEIGLTAIGRVFNISLTHTNWNTALDQILSKVKDMHNSPEFRDRVNVKGLQESYSQAVVHLYTVKDAWRNYTAHARGKYTEQEACLVFENVKEFMHRISSLVKEAPNGH